MGEQRDHRDRASERDPGGQQRQRRGQERTEDQEQDDQRRSGTETGTADTCSGRRLRHLTFDLDLDAVPRARFGGIDEFLRLAGRDLGRLLGQRHVRERNLARARDLPRSCRSVGRCDRRDIPERRDLREHRLDLAADSRVGHLALLDSDDNLFAVARRLRGYLLKKVQRLEALCAREAEAVLVARTDAVADRGQPDQGNQPSGDDEAAVPDAPSGESSHERLPFRVGTAESPLEGRRRLVTWTYLHETVL